MSGLDPCRTLVRRETVVTRQGDGTAGETMSTIAVILVLLVCQLPASGNQGSSPARTARDEAAMALDQKDNARALAAADRAIALAPSDALTHLLRCRALAGLRRHDDAIAARTQSLRLAPNSAEALRDRGHYYSTARAGTPAVRLEGDPCM